MTINVEVITKPAESIDSLLARFRKATRKSGIVDRIKAKQQHLTNRERQCAKRSRAEKKRAKARKKDARAELKARRATWQAIKGDVP